MVHVYTSMKFWQKITMHLALRIFQRASYSTQLKCVLLYTTKVHQQSAIFNCEHLTRDLLLSVVFLTISKASHCCWLTAFLIFMLLYQALCQL